MGAERIFFSALKNIIPITNYYKRKSTMFNPVNRHVQIIVQASAPPETQSGILLPESFKPDDERYIIAQVTAAADDVKFKTSIPPGTQVVVDKSMIEEIKFLGKSINVILENYIIGILEQ